MRSRKQERQRALQLNRIITRKFHSLDDTRPVTVAINGLLSCMDHMGEIMCGIIGITMEQMQQMQAQAAAQPASDAGSDAVNGSTGSDRKDQWPMPLPQII